MDELEDDEEITEVDDPIETDEAEYQSGDVVTVRFTVQKCVPQGMKNLLLLVDDGSGVGFAMCSESEAIQRE